MSHQNGRWPARQKKPFCALLVAIAEGIVPEQNESGYVRLIRAAGLIGWEPALGLRGH